MAINHGWWRVALRDKQNRLLRLARTQAEYARLLEIRVISTHHQLGQLEQTRVGILSAIDRMGGAGLALYAVATRRLAEISVAAKVKETELAELNRTLLKIRLRQETLLRRAEHTRSIGERKTMEAEALDITLGMHRKATGKHRVLE